MIYSAGRWLATGQQGDFLLQEFLSWPFLTLHPGDWNLKVKWMHLPWVIEFSYPALSIACYLGENRIKGSVQSNVWINDLPKRLGFRWWIWRCREYGCFQWGMQLYWGLLERSISANWWWDWSEEGNCSWRGDFRLFQWTVVSKPSLLLLNWFQETDSQKHQPGPYQTG